MKKYDRFTDSPKKFYSEAEYRAGGRWEEFPEERKAQIRRSDKIRAHNRAHPDPKVIAFLKEFYATRGIKTIAALKARADLWDDLSDAQKRAFEKAYAEDLELVA